MMLEGIQRRMLIQLENGCIINMLCVLKAKRLDLLFSQKAIVI